MSIRILISCSAAVLMAATACSSSKSNNSSAGGNSSAAAGSSVTISAKGSMLTAADGHTLYANTVDTVSKISCTGECASLWPPVTGTPKAGDGVDAAKLGTATRSDGTTQVTYDGHPLYEFAEDKAAGDMGGEGVADQGGTWHVATVSGTSASSSSTPSSSYSGGGGY